MEDLYLTLLIIMLFLGPIQILLSIITAIITRNVKLRRYLLIYFLGVGIYLLAMLIYFSALSADFLIEMPEFTVSLRIFFVGSALSLAFFNLIVLLKHRKLP